MDPAAVVMQKPGRAKVRVTPRPVSTGNQPFDDLLGGGYPGGTATLLYGSPFSGKQILQQLAFVAAACDGVPSTFLLHGLNAGTMSRRLNALDERFAGAEREGLVTYVDVHSRVLGETTLHPNAIDVDDPHDAAGLIEALEGSAALRAGRGLLAIQSASTVLMDLGPVRAAAFLRTTLGRVSETGGVSLACVQAGMHSDAELHLVKGLCAGVVELRKRGNMHCLQVEGLPTTVAHLGWIEYEFTPRSFRLKGVL